MIERLANFLRRRSVDLATFGTVFDIGSRDALQSIELAGLFPNAEIVAIECNPGTVELCRRNTAAQPRIRLVERAINLYNGRCQFHPIDTARTATSWADGNPGASSLFLATGDYPAERYVQGTVEVDCIRLDALCAQLGIDVIDLIWMDLQGAELIALQSAGSLLERTRYLYTEVSHRPLYDGQCLFDQVDAFLTARGFRCCTTINRTRWQQDVIYENTRLLIDVMIPLAPEDGEIAELSVRSVRRFVRNVRNVYVVSAEDPRIAGTRWIDEEAFALEKEAVRRHTGSLSDSDPYLRQLIKLHFQKECPSSLAHVLAVDACSIFLRPCRFMDAGRPVLNFGDCCDPSCFEHMARLHPQLHRMMAYSGHTHATLFTRAWVCELHELIESHHPGMSFRDAYLKSIEPAHGELGASEAEVYFHFSLIHHAADVTLRRFNWISTSNLDAVGLDGADYVHLKRGLAGTTADWQSLTQRVSGARESSDA